ncbi:MAG TPA: thioredoxin [Aliiroseovarius sp.]|nr:thioredoxin [Aliiroseovarius sp.]
MRIFATLIVVILAMAFPAMAASEMGDDGLHKAPWLQDTFKDMREDLDDARAQGRRLMIIWEQRGCIYCRKFHEEVAVEPVIDAMLSDEYFVVQMNLFGDVEVTDFDGEVLSERDMAMKWGVMFTPTFMFFAPEVEEGVTAADASVVTMPGAFGYHTTKNLFRWVLDEGYLGDENFQKYHARVFAADQAAAENDG